MNLIKLAQALKKEVKGIIKVSEAMSRHTTWRIGGPADLFFTPVDWMDLEIALKFASLEKLPVTIIGGGSNLLVRDEGIRGLVIHTGGGLKKIKINGEEVIAEAGVKLPFLANRVAASGLSGLEFATGIPGTVGGAVIMNAGAHGSSMGDVVTSVVAMDLQGRLLYFNNEDLEFTYRFSKLKNLDVIVIEIHFKLRRGDVLEIKAQMEKKLEFRKDKQPWEYPNAGSVFKNPPGDSAGRIIDSIGAKGWQVGKAKVSDKHANFIVNLGGASSADVLALIDKIQKEVYKKYKLFLEPEILIMGG